MENEPRRVLVFAAPGDPHGAAAALQRAGCEVVLEHSVRDACVRIRRDWHHAVFAELSGPVEGVLAVLRAARRLPAPPPAIALLTDPPRASEAGLAAVRAAATACLVLPLRVEDLPRDLRATVPEPVDSGPLANLQRGRFSIVPPTPPGETVPMTEAERAVAALLAMLADREPWSQEHARRVAELATRLALELGVDEDSDEYETIRLGALLHDVGRFAVPDAILRKAGPLEEREWRLVQRYPEHGAELVRLVPVIAHASEVVHAAAEHWDGRGYPRRLAGTDIPLGARICAVTDAWEAMTTPRPYRRPLSPEQAVAAIRASAGTQFDPEVVRTFLTMLGPGLPAGAGHAERVA